MLVAGSSHSKSGGEARGSYVDPGQEGESGTLERGRDTRRSGARPLMNFHVCRTHAGWGSGSPEAGIKCSSCYAVFVYLKKLKFFF